MAHKDRAAEAETEGLGKDEINQETGPKAQVGHEQRDDGVEKVRQQKGSGETLSVRTVFHGQTTRLKLARTWSFLWPRCKER
jgi:hypothetical protein